MNESNFGSASSRETAVWAIDPFGEEPRPDKSLIRELIQWVRSSNLEIQPVYVLAGPKGVNVIDTKEASERYLNDLGVEGARPVRVVLSKSTARNDQVTEFLRIVEEERSPWIVVSSHGRSGVERFVLGSFAESLLKQSKHPVMFLTHHKYTGEPDKKMKRAFFATDFTDYSREAFCRFLAEAKRFKMEIVLYHSVALSALAVGYGTPLVIPEDYFPNQIKWATDEGAQWAKFAQSRGIPTRVMISDEGVGMHIATTIIANAGKEGAGLIVMASQSGPVTSFVMGSVAREVFRSNQYPVWIYGPKAIEVSQPLEGTTPLQAMHCG